MAKRRTRAQKEKARHSFNVSWSPTPSVNQTEAKKARLEADVKRQTKSNLKAENLDNIDTKNTVYSVKGTKLGSIKKDIAKSLILSALILASEVVLYLVLS